MDEKIVSDCAKKLFHFQQMAASSTLLPIVHLKKEPKISFC